MPWHDSLTPLHVQNGRWLSHALIGAGRMSRTLTSSEMRVLAHVPNYVVRVGERVTAQVVVLGL